MQDYGLRPDGGYYFTADELRCKCRECNGGEMDDAFMAKVVAVRAKRGVPVAVTSGFRCGAYNDSVSHSGPLGPHTTGHALDIQISGAEALGFLTDMLEQGITGVGVNQTGTHKRRFLHFDDLRSTLHPRPNIWSY